MNQPTDEGAFAKALSRAAAEMGGELTGTSVAGWHHKSLGSRFALRGEDVWIRVKVRESSRPPDKLWTGEEEAASLSGVAKPTFLQAREWPEGQTIWRAEVTSFVAEPVCASDPVLSQALDLPLAWFATLRASLLALSTQETHRVAVRQDLVSRRISERYGRAIRTTVRHWWTSHGDMHWANVTARTPVLLDWEAWGTAPAGLDAAFLLCFSLQRPAIANQVMDTFADVFRARDGQISLLFACAELLRMNELYGDNPTIVDDLVALGERTRTHFPLTDDVH